MTDAVRELLTLGVVIAAGLALGRVTCRGVALGSSGVVFTGLVAGHWGLQVSSLAGTAGIVLFVYCLGIAAGPGFLRSLVRQGAALSVLAAVMIGVAGLTAWSVSRTTDLSPGLTAGLFAGAMTSTPALAAAVESLPVDPEIAVGFGVAYPFGVIGVILFVQMLTRFHGHVVPGDADDRDEAAERISRMLVDVVNPVLAGRHLNDIAALSNAHCQVSRVMVANQLQPIPSEFRLDVGQSLLIIGPEKRLHEVVEVLGKMSDDQNYMLEVEQHRRRVVVTSQQVIGRTLEQLHFRSRFGVTVARIVRHDVEFVPGPTERIQAGDALTAVGEPQALDRLVAFAGHRESALDQTDLVSLVTGLVAGILLGHMELTFAGRSFTLGLAGGPLIVGLVLGQAGRVGRIVGHVPRAARLLLAEVGLTLFLARAGTSAGQAFLPVIRDNGVILCLAASSIVVLPLGAGLLLARWHLQLSHLETTGGICGAMTSTPGLGAATSVTESSVPLASYATVYPVALVFITLMAPVLISFVS